MSNNSKSKQTKALTLLIDLLSSSVRSRSTVWEEVDPQPAAWAEGEVRTCPAITIPNPDPLMIEELRDSLLITLTLIGHDPCALEKLDPVELCRRTWSSLEDRVVRLMRVSEASTQSNRQRAHTFSDREYLAVGKAMVELQSSGKKRVGRVAVGHHARRLLSLAGEPRSAYLKLTPARTERLMRNIESAASAQGENDFWAMIKSMPLSPYNEKKSE